MLKLYNVNQKELILQDVFETVLDHGTFKMVEELYEYLNLCNIKGNAALDNIFFNAIRKHNELLDLMKKSINQTSAKSAVDETSSATSHEEAKCPKVKISALDLTNLCLKREISYDNSENRFLSPAMSPIKGKTRDCFSPERKQLCASPVVYKELEYSDKRERVKRYIDSINLRSEHYKQARLYFRRRTFKQIKDMNNNLVEDQMFMNLDKTCENCNETLGYSEIMRGMKKARFV